MGQRTADTTPRPLAPPAVFVGLFFTAMAVLLFQIALTRVFAILLWYHFAYLIVALALLGFGASGSLLAVRGSPATDDRGFLTATARHAGAFAITLLLAFFAVTRLEIDSFKIWRRVPACLPSPWSVEAKKFGGFFPLDRSPVPRFD